MCAFIRVVYTLCTFDFLIFPRLAQFEMDCQTVRARDRLIPGGIQMSKIFGNAWVCCLKGQVYETNLYLIQAW